MPPTLFLKKQEINAFLDREEKVLKNTITLTDNVFTFIEDQYISLEEKENYIIPSKSMPQK